MFLFHLCRRVAACDSRACASSSRGGRARFFSTRLREHGTCPPNPHFAVMPRLATPSPPLSLHPLSAPLLSYLPLDPHLSDALQLTPSLLSCRMVRGQLPIEAPADAVRAAGVGGALRARSRT